MVCLTAHFSSPDLCSFVRTSSPHKFMISATVNPPVPSTTNLKQIAEATGLILVLVSQRHIDLYEVYAADGELLYISVAEQFDDHAAWNRRTEAEQDAMITLALDEYHGTMNWDEVVAIEILPVDDLENKNLC